MNKNYVKLLSLLLVAAVMATALLGCKSKKEPKATEPTAATESAEAPAVVEPEVTETEMEATETEPDATEEVIAETEPEVDAPEAGSLTYEEFMALNAEVQQAYFEKFATADDFFSWLAKVKEDYQVEQDATQGEDSSEGDDFFAEEGVEDLE